MADPYTNTRREFTEAMLNRPIPDAATPQYRTFVSGAQKVLRALAYHPAMEPNIDQPFMTPANKKSRVYFMWDFCGRTLGMALAIDASLPRSTKKVWEEVNERTVFADVLFHDNSGKMELLGQEAPGQAVEFGKEVVETSEALMEGLKATDK